MFAKSLKSWLFPAVIVAFVGHAHGEEDFLFSTGEHNGLFLRGEVGVLGKFQLERKTKDSLKTMAVGSDGAPSFVVGLGWSTASCFVLHLQLEVSPLSSPDITMLSVGPALTWYAPHFNTYLTGHLGYSRISELGGDKGWRWSIATGKELLFAKEYGIGLQLSYGGGSWDESVKDYPSWSMSGMQLHIVTTIN